MANPCGTNGRGSIGMLAIGEAAEAQTDTGEQEVTGAEFGNCGEAEADCGEVEEASANRGWKLGKDHLESSLKEETTEGSRAGPTDLNQSWTASMFQASTGGLSNVANRRNGNSPGSLCT